MMVQRLAHVGTSQVATPLPSVPVGLALLSFLFFSIYEKSFQDQCLVCVEQVLLAQLACFGWHNNSARS